MSAEIDDLIDEVANKSSSEIETSPKDVDADAGDDKSTLKDIEASLWETELEIALLTKCDYGTIRNLAKCRPIPSELRPKVWQICLDVQDKENMIENMPQVFDLPQQNKIREDCENFVSALDNSEDEKIELTSYLESIITFYCKNNNEDYERDNGWLDVMKPLITLDLRKSERYQIYNLFSAILNRYIPKDCVRNGSPYHLFRLLLLYHDPELCAFLDTKKITPDFYAHLWIRSLFAAKCDLKVVLNVWDVYFQLGDQFLIFFLALVLVINSKEQIMSSKDIDRNEIIKIMNESLSGLNAEDIEDFCNLAQHYESKTPQSFRKEYQKPMFDGISLEAKASSIYQALCLPVSVTEILQANQLGTKGVRYFVVDCRPAEQYNNSHFATAFHLDANLMLENQLEFNQAVDALLSTQKQAIATNSIAGGEHLCFIGSGSEEEDKYVNMVVANFLQRKIKFISLALGGYKALAMATEDPKSIVQMKTESTVEKGEFNRTAFTEDWIKKIHVNTSIFNKLSNVVSKVKTTDIKDKVKDYLSLSHEKTAHKHVKPTDKADNGYRNQGNIFKIDDEDDECELPENDQQTFETVSVQTWLSKPDVLNKFKCFEVVKGSFHPAHLLITNSHIYGLREIPDKKGMALISVRRPLTSLVKITSKKNTPELISFKFGNTGSNSGNTDANQSGAATNGKQVSLSNEKNDVKITAIDQFYIPEAGEASKAVKMQVIKILDLI